jgi:putative endonuclease
MSLPAPTPRHWAEGVAREFLEARGFRFITGNHSERGGELDLIMRDGDVLVFVEVRQRSSALYGSAAETLDTRKLRRLQQPATLFMLRRYGTTDLPCRFDAVLLNGSRSDHTVQHLEGIL